MKVQEFIKSVEGLEVTEGLKLIKIEKYVPFDLKKDIIETALLEKVVYIKDSMATYNSIEKYLAFTTTAIVLYTDLEIDVPSADYDSLVETGYLRAILEGIGEDYYVFRDLFEMRFSDKIREVNTLEAIVNAGIQDLLLNIDTTLANLNKVMENIDEKTLNKYITKLSNKIKK